jgi:hypothetical protein
MAHLEERFGALTGHAEAFAMVERFLDRAEPDDTGQGNRSENLTLTEKIWCSYTEHQVEGSGKCR